jgi:ABC-type multidrug transport system permease subunit
MLEAANERTVLLERLESVPPAAGASAARAALRLLRLHMERNARIYSYFKVVAVLGLLQSLAQALLFLYFGRLVASSASQAVGGNYASFLITGMIAIQCLDKCLIAPFVSLSGAYWSARLEALLMSPYSLWFFILADTLWYNALTLVNSAVILIVGLYFGARFGLFGSPIILIFSMVLAATAVLGLGLISASLFSLINAKGQDEPISWTVHLVQGVVCGLYFPFTVLPKGFQIVGLLLPHTYAIDTARRVLIAHFNSSATLPVHLWCGGNPIVVNMVELLVQACIYVPLGIYSFNCGLKKAQRVGSLSRWT